MAKNTPQISPEEAEHARSTTPPKKKGDQRASTQQHLSFSEIKDGIIEMRDGGLRMVILCSPTNFDLKSPAEKDAMEFAYQGFLNGLHFPIQIVVQSRRVDLDNYLENLENIQANQSNGLLAGLMEDYIFNIRELLQEVNIMDKRFYVVVPYAPGQDTQRGFMDRLQSLFIPATRVSLQRKKFLERRKVLMQRVDLVLAGLQGMGLNSVVLNTQNLIELYYESYNPDVAEQQKIKDVNKLDVEQVTGMI